MNEALKQKYIEFLISRLFVSIEYPSIEAFLDDIRSANQMDDATQWRDKKAKFNEISLKAPMTDIDGYCLTYAEIPDFIENEGSHFAQVFA